MGDEGLITKEEAVLRVEPAPLDQLLHPTIDPKATRDVIATGLPASPGAATGKIVFDRRRGRGVGEGRRDGHPGPRRDQSPEDIHGMHAAEGILTARGGMTSHAAVVARGMGTPCVSGAGELQIDYAAEDADRRRQGASRKATSSPSTAHGRGPGRRGADRSSRS